LQFGVVSVQPKSPALILRFPSNFTHAQRDRLSATLAEHDLVAIQEDDVDYPAAWSAHFASAGSRDAAADRLKADAEFAAIPLQSVEVEDEDWARRTQADLPAIRIGHVIIAPPWDLPAQSSAPGSHPDIVVLIEPSRGFGTGHHQSTRLCAVLLQNRNLSGLTVTDVGTGSGVLAITAAKLGASFVAAIDSDPDAVENARENIAANHVEAIVEAHVDDLEKTTVPRADLVLANLTGTLLARHAADLERLVRPGGSLIVSGFTIDERDRVTAALTPFFDITEAAEEDDWHAFVVNRRSPGAGSFAAATVRPKDEFS
jgi:ribosomal protein L11 methyltransferase